MGTAEIACKFSQARKILDRDYIDSWIFLFACRRPPIASNIGAAEARLRSPSEISGAPDFWTPTMSMLNNSAQLPKTPDLEQERSAMGTVEIAVKKFQARKILGRDGSDP